MLFCGGERPTWWVVVGLGAGEEEEEKHENLASTNKTQTMNKTHVRWPSNDCQ